jgi:rhodanese-related sulfurtransferase
VDLFVFVSEQWMLVSLLCVLVYAYAWNEKAKGGKSLSVHGMTLLVNKGDAVVVDLREAAEFKNGHIVDAINIPHNKVAERMSELAKFKEKTVVLVDKMGQHAGNAGRTLRKEGYEVNRLEGGMSEWQNQNLPLVTK